MTYYIIVEKRMEITYNIEGSGEILVESFSASFRFFRKEHFCL
jgi:hypothetical protein